MNEIQTRARIAEYTATSAGFQARLNKARAIVSEALSSVPSWYVAVSGGKDSTVVLALVREQVPDAPAVSSIQEWRLPETAEYLAHVPALTCYATGTDHGTGWAPNWESPDDVPAGVEWLGAKIGNQDRTVRNFGRAESGVFLGLRADESAARRVHLRKMGVLFLARKDETWRCSPIAAWTIRDVWAFILSRGLDYNRAYDRLCEIGVPLDQQRIGPLAVDRVLGYGPLAILKRGWPELFNRYAACHPEARLYV